MPLKNGTLLSGTKYRIVRYISGGGFGCTYEAIHTGLNGRFAIKEFFLKDYCNRDAETGFVTVGTTSKTDFVDKLKARFIREARLQFKLRHPGIVHVSDVFEENGTAYYVMDYIDGENLGEISDRLGRMSEQEALRYIRDVCDALKYVHSKGHLHLDIKPQNIMVDREGHAIMIDFGTSKQYEDEGGAVTTTTFGLTPGYAPAELHDCDKDSYTPASDIYSLGATLYKLLTGETPATAMKRSSGIPLTPLPSYITETTRTAVEKAMNLRRDQRPQSIDEFLALLEKKPTTRQNAKAVNTHTNDNNATKILNSNNNVPTAERRSTNQGTKDNIKDSKVWRKDDNSSERSTLRINTIIILGLAVFSIIGLMFYGLNSSHSAYGESLDSDTSILWEDDTTVYDTAAAEDTVTYEASTAAPAEYESENQSTPKSKKKSTYDPYANDGFGGPDDDYYDAVPAAPAAPMDTTIKK